ncbi:MAG: hypothetical protein HYU48_00655 [Candidatus Levybacteria bacterium]|nr:hypothetical protein [Candidatus Levybacteria bacterium]
MDVIELIVKILMLVLIACYIVFTLVVFNQVLVMNRIVTLNHASGFLKTAAVFHILLAISLFVAALVIL